MHPESLLSKVKAEKGADYPAVPINPFHDILFSFNLGNTLFLY